MAREFDTAQFSKGLAREVAKIKLDARREIQAVGEDAVERAQSLAPHGSGAMADSIKSEPGFDKSGPYADVTVDPYYSSFVEFGTSKMAARPFMRPAVAAAVKRIRRRP